MTFLLFVAFLLVLFFTSQKILITSLSNQFLVQTNSLTEVIRGTLKPYVLSENISAVRDEAREMLALDDVEYIRVYSYDEPLFELHADDYPERQFQLDKTLLDASDGYFDVQYVFDVEGTKVGKVLISFSIEDERLLLLNANRKLAFAAVLMTVFGLIVTWFLAGRIASRIQMLERASNSFAAGDEHVELPLDGEDEIASTGRAFENMMWQIREKYEATNLSPDGILLVSSNHRISYTNPALITILGEMATDLYDKTFEEFENRLIKRLDQRAHQDVKHIGELLQLPEFRVHMPDFKIIRCIRKRVESPDGRSFSQVFYLRDITHESEIDRMKSEFLTTAAHELRTPLASVMGFSELLMTNEYDKDKIKFVAETINRQSLNLKRLVDDLLDIARIEARSQGVVNLEQGYALSVVNECCELMAGGDKQCQLFYEPDECVWPEIAFDQNKLKQALMNILSNAYKYSEVGGIVIVDTVMFDDDEQISWFGIRVTDQGIGMNQEQLSHVGEKFYRADDSGAIPGTGLGMALTSEILSLHNGHLDITSQLGQGTQVTLWIPVAEYQVEKRANG
jgi:signal transduction histidine kinase/HAMP domain-containing protein